MPTLIKRSFTSGELSPSLHARTDVSKYQTGLAECTNFFVRPQGGVYNRAGLRFIGELSDSSQRGRLIPFSFNTEQTYILVFENLKMRVIKDGGYVMSGGVPYEIATPYTSAELSRLYFTQSADVMTIVHPNHDPMDLTRLAHDNWLLTTKSFSASVASPSGLSAVAVGGGAGSNTKTYEYVVTAIGADGSESIPSVKVTITTGSLSVTAGVKVSWSAVTGATMYKVYKSDSVSTDIFGFIGDSLTTEFTDFNIAPDTSLAPPKDNQPFSGVGNKPSTVSYYQQRQVYANSINKPQTFWATQLDNYNSMRYSEPSRDDDSITLNIAARQVNEIRHIVSLDSLILMTSGAEWRIIEDQNGTFTPKAGVKVQSYNGSSNVPPVVINDTILYVKDKGTSLRDLGYSFTSDKYIGSDLSILSQHLFYGYNIDEMAYADEPYGIVWLIRNDGTLLGLTYQKEQQVWGWHKHTTKGKFESVAVISEGDRDATYVIVNRIINGVTRRYVERLEKREDNLPEDCFYVDSGLSYNGAPVMTISGLSHLEGEQVSVLADGNTVYGLTVAGGSITLPRAASKIHVGLPYDMVIQTLPIDSGETGEVRGSVKSVSDVRIVVEKSRGGWIGSSRSDLIEIKPRVQADQYDPISLKSDTFRVNIQPQWNKNGQIYIEQKDPLPLAILAIIPKVDIGD